MWGRILVHSPPSLVRGGGGGHFVMIPSAGGGHRVLRWTDVDLEGLRKGAARYDSPMAPEIPHIACSKSAVLTEVNDALQI